MRTLLATLVIAATGALLVALPATAKTGKGQLFHDGSVVGTVVTPSPIAAGAGTDPFYNVTNGAAGQLGIAGVAPGDGPYHGGSWQVFLETPVTSRSLDQGPRTSAAQLSGSRPGSRPCGTHWGSLARPRGRARTMNFERRA